MLDEGPTTAKRLVVGQKTTPGRVGNEENQGPTEQHSCGKIQSMTASGG